MLSRRQLGFTLIEMMVAVSVLIILAAVAMPNFSTWIRNSRVRSVTETLQSGIRLAQAEAQRRTRTVAFFRTSSNDCSNPNTAVAAAAGSYWQVRVVADPLQTDDAAEAVQCGVFNDVPSRVTMTTTTTVLCFGPDGRQTTVVNPANLGVNCAAATAQYDLAPATTSAENRALRVVVSLAGSIRLCDPNKASTAPDGCRSS